MEQGVAWWGRGAAGNVANELGREFEAAFGPANHGAEAGAIALLDG